ncbi:CAP domain-containing protein [Mucilaginibacter flavus]|uniref:CAP domain-containing protein n=1 Tax=Mucilaginibacter flavus TaxID=931504 RepID=UPI0025B58846|nr:CAP domain-containing protein [Mucilaginibacter flavus]MDN3580186.1 CAP domain-containing protein [Mucilaginibacter flavus]
MKAPGTTIGFYYRQAMLLGGLLISLAGCKKDTTVAPPQLVDIKADLLSNLNALRAKGCYCGTDSMKPVKPVIWNDELQKAAADHAKDMYDKNYFAHVSPQGVTPGDWAKQEGYNAVSLGEDIAQNYDATAATVMAWKDSPEHCTVMMDSTYHEAGAARYGNYWVLLMGKR